MCTGRRGQATGTESKVFEPVLLTIDSPVLDNIMPRSIALSLHRSIAEHIRITESLHFYPADRSCFYLWSLHFTGDKTEEQRNSLPKDTQGVRNGGPGESPSVGSAKHCPTSCSCPHPERAEEEYWGQLVHKQLCGAHELNPATSPGQTACAEQ